MSRFARVLVSVFAVMASCFAGALEVPDIKGKAYHDARKEVLAAGWQPVPFTGEVAPFDPAIDFRKAGYAEVEGCGGAASFCSFYFTDGKDQKLQIVTAGEEGKRPDGSSAFAVVDNYRVTSDSFGLQVVLKEVVSDSILEERDKDARQKEIWAGIVENSKREMQEWCTPMSATYRNLANSRDSGLSKEQMLAEITRNAAGNLEAERLLGFYVERVYGEFRLYKPNEVDVLVYQECLNANQSDFQERAEKEYEEAIKNL